MVMSVRTEGNTEDSDSDDLLQSAPPKPEEFVEVADVKDAIDKACDLCGGEMLARKGKWGLFWGCKNYFETGCKFTRNDRKPKQQTLVVLEIEGRGEFRVHLQLAGKKRCKPKGDGKLRAAGEKKRRTSLASATCSKKRRTAVHERASAIDCNSSAKQSGFIGEEQRDAAIPGEEEGEEGGMLRAMLTSAKLVPLRINRREDGVFGAVFELARYEVTRHRLQALSDIRVKPIPPPTLNFFRKLEQSRPWDRCGAARVASGGHEDTGHEESDGTPCISEGKDDRPEPVYGRQEEDEGGGEWWEGGRWLERVGEGMRRALLGFQREGVEFVLRQGGRALVADDMGLGKTLQALAVAAALQAWPLLVVCPATVRLVWAEEVERWLPTVSPRDLHIIFGSASKLPLSGPSPKVVICSYAMLRVLEDDLVARRWGMLVLDESHSVSTSPSSSSEVSQTLAALRLAACVRYVVLLSGTPSLSKPFGLYNQVNLLREGLLGRSKFVFGVHYCSSLRSLSSDSDQPRGSPISGFSAGGGGACGRAWELNVLLREAVMVRRMKCDVLAELPAKRRQLVRVHVNTERRSWWRREQGRGRGAREGAESLEPEACQVDDGDEEGACSVEETQEDGEAAADGQGGTDRACRNGTTKYKAVGLGKVEEGVKWLRHLLKSASHTHKVVVFGHHRAVLDGVMAGLVACSVGVVRIDGETLVRQRADRIKAFHRDAKIRVAVVSVTAGGQGIDLSCAALAVFFEIPPDCGWVAQAEDRLHRRGQARGVVVCYLVAYAGPNASEAETELEDYDMARWTSVARMVRAVSDVTDGPTHARGLDAEAIRNFEESLGSIDVDGDHVRASRHDDDSNAERSSQTIADRAAVCEREMPPGNDAADQSLRGGAPVFFEVSVHTARVHVHLKGDGSCPLGASLSPASIDSWDGSRGSGSVEVAELRAVLCRRGLLSALSAARVMDEATRFLAQYRMLSSSERRQLRSRCCCCAPDDSVDDSRRDSAARGGPALPAEAKLGTRDDDDDDDDDFDDDGTGQATGLAIQKRSAAILGKRRTVEGSESQGAEGSEGDVSRQESDSSPAREAIGKQALNTRVKGEGQVRDNEVGTDKSRESQTRLHGSDPDPDAEGRERRRKGVESERSFEGEGAAGHGSASGCLHHESSVRCEEEGGTLSSSPAADKRSRRRVTPRGEAPGAPLPDGAFWWEVAVKPHKAGGASRQLWASTADGAVLCLWCMEPLGSRYFYEPAQRARRGEAIQYHSLFCSGECLGNYYQRTSRQSMRRQLEQEELGVCQQCGLDCASLLERVAVLDKGAREKAMRKAVPAFGNPGRQALLRRVVEEPVSGNLWHADHVVPVFAGGGECGLDNMRTLCVLCHADVTCQQAKGRAALRVHAQERAAGLTAPTCAES